MIESYLPMLRYHRQVAPITDIYEVPWREFQMAVNFVEALAGNEFHWG